MKTPETGVFIDSRDGKQYKWVKIGEQTWMAENLAYKASSGTWAYNDDDKNISKYGYLYNFETALNASPLKDGWRLPTKKDFDILLKNTGSSPNLNYAALTENGSSGFSVINAGWRNLDGTYSYMNEYGGFWSSNAPDEKNVWVLYFDGVNAYPFTLSKNQGYSIRCIKNE